VDHTGLESTFDKCRRRTPLARMLQSVMAGVAEG